MYTALSDQTPLVSIVTPSYNQGKFVEQTIQSVLAQDYPNIEYIIMDGGSTDDTLSIIRKYQDKISKWASEPDGGQSNAINKGWRMARGDILAWLNSDDMYPPGAVSSAVSALLKIPAVGMVFGDSYLIDAQGKFISRYSSKNKNGYRKGMPVEHDIPQPAVFIRKRALQEVGFLNEDLNYCMDYELYMRIAKRFDIIYTPQVLAQMRIYMGTKTSQNTFINMQEKIEVLKRYHPRWYLSRYGQNYILHKYIWRRLPHFMQLLFRKFRASNYDRILMDLEKR